MAQATLTTTTTEEQHTTNDRTCPECDDARVVQDGHEQVCEACGLVVDDKEISRGPDWRRFGEELVGLKRCNGGPVREDHHLDGHDTLIVGTYDANGNPISSKKHIQLSRFRTQEQRLPTKVQQNRRYALCEIRRIAGVLDVPADTKDRAARLFKDAQDADLLRGRSIEAFASGALYAACREDRVVRTLADFADASKCSKSDVELGYGVLNRELALAAQPMRPRELVARIASAVGLPAEVRAVAHENAVAAENADLHAGGRRPSSVAAAAVYAAGQGRVTQKEVAAAADITPPTLRNAWRDVDALAG